jgi:hypothetical protein
MRNDYLTSVFRPSAPMLAQAVIFTQLLLIVALLVFEPWPLTSWGLAAGLALLVIVLYGSVAGLMGLALHAKEMGAQLPLIMETGGAFLGKQSVFFWSPGKGVVNGDGLHGLTIDHFSISDSAQGMIEEALRLNASILISGETHSGKTTLARVLMGNKAFVDDIRDRDQAQDFIEGILARDGRAGVLHSIHGLGLRRLLWIAHESYSLDVDELADVQSFQTKLRDKDCKLLGLHVDRQSNNTYRVTVQDFVSGYVA